MVTATLKSPKSNGKYRSHKTRKKWGFCWATCKFAIADLQSWPLRVPIYSTLRTLRVLIVSFLLLFVFSPQNIDKVPVSKVKKHLDVELEVPVSPTTSSSADSMEDELSSLRAQNKILTEALKEMKKSATKAFEKNYDLVWYARNRCKYRGS